MPLIWIHADNPVVSRNDDSGPITHSQWLSFPYGKNRPFRIRPRRHRFCRKVG